MISDEAGFPSGLCSRLAFLSSLLFLTYVLRSAPGVMIPELSNAFGLTALGVSTLVGLYYSSAAVIPYMIAKEANPDSVKGSTTGAINFLVFSFSAFLAQVFGVALQQFSGAEPLTLQTFHQADLIWAGAIILSLILTFFVRETGAAARPAPLTASPHSC